MAPLRSSSSDRDDDTSRSTRRVILEGASNYNEWKTDCNLQLKTKGLHRLSKKRVVKDPDRIAEGSHEETTAINEFPC